MSRPPISYPSPLVGTSNLVPVAPHTNPGYHSRPSLEPSPVSGPSERRPSHSSSRQVSGPSSRHGTGSLDSEITRLLVTTKQMLQGLEAWAVGNLDEDGVSDIYVKLGNGFEQCTTSFQRAGIATDELESIPSDLRLCLEQCLSEDPSQETLNVYLPSIRNIIVSLLNGLKQKQSAYKRLMTERQQSDTPPPIQPRALPRADLSTDSRLSARSGNSSMSQGSTSPASISSGLPIPRIPSSQALSERARQGLPSRPAPPDAFRPPRRIPEPPRRSVSPQPQPQPQSSPFIPHERVSSTSSSAQELPHLVRHQLSDNPVPPAGPQRQNSSTPPPAVPPKPAPPHPDRFSRDSFGNSRISRFSADSDVTNGSPIRSPTAQTPKSQKSPAKSLASLPEANEGTDQSRRSSEHSLPPTLPPLLPTLNLPSSSMLFPDPPGADLPTPVEAIPDVPPETRATLAALGRSDALERRASKRFSSYTFNKLPGSPSHKKAASVGSPQRPMRRVDRPPPLPSLPESLAGSNLAAAMNGEDVNRARTPPPRSDLLLPSVDDRDHPSSSPASIMTDRSDGSTGSVRRVKTPEPAEPSAQATPRPAGDQSSASIPTTQAAADSLSLFLQIGRQVKKATVELPISLSSLRLLFMERFEYDPGMEDFPDVYMRDTKTGVQFELEDMEDLKEGCVLSLNIEPLDQVKQHFDIAFNSMTQELKELKTALDHSRRISTSPNSAFLAVSPSSQAISRIPLVRTESSRPSSPSPRSNNAPLVGPQREAELRAQYDEVQSLRRDLAVMRQIHVDFLAETKEVFGKLRKENNGMRDLVKTKIGGSRALLDNSRIKLDSLSTETIQAVEEISDIIDAARLDASKRFVTPSRTQWASIRADFKKASEMVESFATEVTTSEPTWRATWHQELSRVMEEQRLLPHWTKLTEDLKNDIKDAEGMLQNLQDFVDQRITAGGGQGQAGSGQSVTLRSTPKGFRPPSPDESGGGGINHLLMEIRTKEADPHQRLRAIEAQQKAREREKANKTDEFSEELAGFVQGRKLKKTGGTDETERQRQRRHEQTLKRMMNPAPEGSPGGGSGGKQGMLSPQITGMSTSSVGGGMGSASPVGKGSRQSSATVNPNSATAGSGRESRNSTTSSVDVKPEVKVDVKEE